MSASLDRRRADPAPRWRPSAFIRASFAWHGAMALGAVAAPQAWPWWLGGLAANHALLTGAGLWPRSRLLGANLLRVPECGADGAPQLALTIDDGPDPEVTPRVLDQLAAAGARATFFCIGSRVLAQPALARRIVADGHEIGNHTMHHRHDFSVRGPKRLRKEIGDAQQAVADTVGRMPVFFRAPAGLRNPLLDPVLQSLGLRLTAWTRRPFDTRRADPSRALARLTDGLAAGDILLLHDGHAARDVSGTPVAVGVLPPLLARCAGDGLRCVTLSQAFASRSEDSRR